MTVHVYVDESKAADYLLAATMVEPGRVPASRSAVRALVPPRQNRLHMRHEPDRRRRAILSALGRLDVTTTLYRAPASGGRPRSSADGHASPGSSPTSQGGATGS
ncbi:hypothetical protein [Cellulomonas endometrii]|uniref:hypothetical protein n=1 Tax=Cellulomonas endometrii TaxID=3036301 RepID=UPI0024ADD9CF|nr:hypothetical protein [Cellulomonas endometrii]